jgi:phage terminase large subunit
MKLEIGLSDKQFEFQGSLSKFDVTGYGGAKGGGKSAGARLVGLLECLTVPGLITGLFRRSYPELQDNHIGPLFKQFPELRAFYNSSEKTVRIPSLESELRFRYCENMSDVDRQAGREYHRLLIEEAGDWLYEMWMGLIRNTNRCPIPGIRPSTGLCFNWGGLGHGHLKRIFWAKDLRPNEKDLTWNFILAKVEDNPKLMENDPGYLRRLESEPNEALRRAHRHGDPDIVAGQYFTELNRAVHVVKPFQIPAYWRWFGSYDYGFNHPSVWHFWASDEDGNVYLVAEIYKAGMFIEHQAKAVFETATRLGIKPPLFSAGHDCWATKKAGDPTIAEDFVKRKIILTKANIQRVLGWKHVREYLHHEIKSEKRVGPRVFMFDTCPMTINCLQRMVHDPNNAEDVLKVDSSNGDVESGDDGADCFRYGLMSRPPIAIPVESPTLDRYKKKLSPTNSWTVA